MGPFRVLEVRTDNTVILKNEKDKTLPPFKCHRTQLKYWKHQDLDENLQDTEEKLPETHRDLQDSMDGRESKDFS
uniref:Uncharacterized protein n=1 Tax=Parastrongyloides trichosuri TaxID=131310 RepID=A0A0N4ZXX8_PARTI